MENILVPEKNNNLLKLYHKSNKFMIPLVASSIIARNIIYSKKDDVPDSKVIVNSLDSLNILNLAYHSYVSTSCVITDYIKPVNVARCTRGLSLGLHGLAIYGYLNKIYKK